MPDCDDTHRKMTLWDIVGVLDGFCRLFHGSQAAPAGTKSLMDSFQQKVFDGSATVQIGKSFGLSRIQIGRDNDSGLRLT